MRPVLSVIIPVLREAAVINDIIFHLKATEEALPTEVIVVDGSPAGDTLSAVAGKGVVKIRCAPGRGSQMNAGAAAASGEILLFLHADTKLPAGAGSRIAALCDDPAVAGGAFDLVIDSPRPVFRVIEKAASLRSRATRIPYGDQAIFIKAVVFHSIGGFRHIDIMEDIDLMQRLKRRRYRIRFADAPVRTSPRRWEKEGVLYTTIRNWILSTLFYLGASPDRLKRYYR